MPPRHYSSPSPLTRQQTLRPVFWACAFFALVASCAEEPPGRGRGSRSPTVDYREEPRAAGDGEVLGADQQAPSDWLAGEVTNEHQAYRPGAEKPTPARAEPSGDAGVKR